MRDEERERFIYAINMDGRLTFAARLVGIRMLLHGGQQDEAQIGRDIGCSRKQVRTAIKALTGHGYGWLLNVPPREVRT